jgi:hypothetical protein
MYYKESYFMKSLLFCLLVIIQFNASAGEISKVFGVGIFDTLWGDSVEDVNDVFPDGKIETYGDITQLVIKDGRSVFGLERDKKALIRFAFDSEGRLNGAAVYFDGDDYTSLISKLSTLFGEYSKPNPQSYTALQWPKDNEITLFLSLAPSTFSMETVFSIGYSGLNKPSKSKEELGF